MSASAVSKSRTERFNRLLRGNIIGIIDSNGAVHSRFTGDKIEHHETHWPTMTHARWRWNHDRSIYWFLLEHRPNEEEIDAVMRHLTKRYGLLWWENGHHDIDDLLKKAGVSGFRDGFWP